MAEDHGAPEAGKKKKLDRVSDVGENIPFCS